MHPGSNNLDYNIDNQDKHNSFNILIVQYSNIIVETPNSLVFNFWRWHYPSIFYDLVVDLYGYTGVCSKFSVS